MSIEGIKTTIGYTSSPDEDTDLVTLPAVIDLDQGAGLHIRINDSGERVWIDLEDLTDVLRFYGYTLAEAAQEGK
ncbi:hypothetical protein [Patulibacter minatonensis]|uniref:hypothetical protein n=1 Tax=Patulibacter minatonensis TaxID=298163 RepID=UPI00047997F0|nr:hypothetical protein [Patulibacter minatonensis]